MVTGPRGESKASAPIAARQRASDCMASEGAMLRVASGRVPTVPRGSSIALHRRKHALSHTSVVGAHTSEAPTHAKMAANAQGIVG